MVERSHLQLLVKRVEEPGRFIQVLAGSINDFPARKFQVHNTALISARSNELKLRLQLRFIHSARTQG